MRPETENTTRDAVIVRTSVIGILANVFLAAFKAAVGLISNSIAVILDAVNNLSDAAASVITIIGTKLAAKQPDKKHPFGYGRVEYFSAMIISLLVLYAGVTSLVESVKKIVAPETPDYSAAALIIIAAAVAVKLLLGRYVKSVGRRVNSDSLVNSGEDATLDSVISAATLVAAGIYLIFGVSLEAWLGAIISAVIIKSGVEMLLETLSKLLGERADAALARDIKQTICDYPGVSGAYDLILHDYGPDSYQASVHIEVADTVTADELDSLIRAVTAEVFRKHGVILTAVGVYSINTKDERAAEIRDRLYGEIGALPHVLELHGFYLDDGTKTIRFDVVVSLGAPDRAAVYREAAALARSLYPDYAFQIVMDTDFSEE